MIDIERKGKASRQFGKNLFLSDHSIDDILAIKSTLKTAKLVVRINPLDEESSEEIKQVLDQGADYVMLPYFHKFEEAELFCHYINKQAKAILLVETAQAANQIHQLSQLKCVDEIHIGLNDLRLSMKYNSIFDLILDGTVEKLCHVLKKSGKPYGFGGVAKLSSRSLPVNPEWMLAQQIRLGCTVAWLGRTFRDGMAIEMLNDEVKLLRSVIQKWKDASEEDFLKLSFSETICG
jgi:citrate lyase beta subunit